MEEELLELEDDELLDEELDELEDELLLDEDELLELEPP